MGPFRETDFHNESLEQLAKLVSSGIGHLPRFHFQERPKY